ncbi:DNA repair protein XRCC2 homolog [Impatiens glandulifera]|uniref:DNA repair protein XRCC2 homolog n=1 Tax=Impatiens glandulifera TaxID=253017 RepID=UPI001FB088B7|nr:DNA repair protein XRCC2 homolog [Impatiens glandulifera]
MAGEVEEWIRGDETALKMLTRVQRERPLLLLPPLHKVPLRLGNIVEIAGPSPSSKTQILLQAAINCILPKEWKGVSYGGLGHLVIFFDLDCRFDVLRLSQLLKYQIMKANGLRNVKEEDPISSSKMNDKELFDSCMRRFLYMRCYSSSEFLASLKTVQYQVQKERDKHGHDVKFLMIDSIGAFYWIDRASTSLPVIDINRKRRSLQTVSESIVQEIRKLLVVNPMLVLATKTTSLGYRETMPSIWQSFVTHRVFVRDSDHVSNSRNCRSYRLEWLLPAVSSSTVEFLVTDAGIVVIS